MQAISNNTAINVSFVEDRARQARFTTGNIRHRVVQMGGKGNPRAETGFRFFQRRVGVTSRNHNPGICQFADDFRWNHFRCQSHFGNHVGVLTQEIDQRGIRLTHKIRIMGAFFYQIQPRTFQMQT